jgi:plasmid stabilization system protein ParE
MVEVVWTEPALADLEAIADYIALENPAAASALVARVYTHVGQLTEHPESGSRPVELGKTTRYRQIVEPPCRVFYRFDGARVVVLYVMRGERLFRSRELINRAKGAGT